MSVIIELTKNPNLMWFVSFFFCQLLLLHGVLVKIIINGKYRYLHKKSFENKIKIKNKYNVVSLIGAMTYCDNHQLLFKLVSYYLSKNGYFIFTQRVDLWKELKFDNVLKKLTDFDSIYISRPLNYLPNNKDFGSDIKIRIVLLKKK